MAVSKIVSPDLATFINVPYTLTDQYFYCFGEQDGSGALYIHVPLCFNKAVLSNSSFNITAITATFYTDKGLINGASRWNVTEYLDSVSIGSKQNLLTINLTIPTSTPNYTAGHALTGNVRMTGTYG